jgi:ornithine carbamoyltransferase
MLLSPYPWCPTELSPEDGLALVASAERLKLAAASATGLRPVLLGKRLALLSDDHASPSAQAFEQAATALGGHVARVPASGPGEHHVQELAALLGQLYDAIECQGLAPADLRQLGRNAGVPVFDCMAGAHHPLRRLAASMAGDPAANHRHLLQALLSNALA